MLCLLLLLDPESQCVLINTAKAPAKLMVVLATSHVASLFAEHVPLKLLVLEGQVHRHTQGVVLCSHSILQMVNFVVVCMVVVACRRLLL
jgi:hypothetical protein